jgi:hypothetical protein
VTIGKDRAARARELCTVAVGIIRSAPDAALDGLGTFIKRDHLWIGYYTPFQKRPNGGVPSRKLPDQARYLAAQLTQIDPQDEPYGIDVWDKLKGKVLSVVWHDGKEPVVVSYKPGDWEFALMALAQAQKQG